MPSFQVLVLGFSVRFLSPFPDSLPQLFLRCLPCALAFGLSPSDPLPFVRFSSGSGYSASVSSFPLSSQFRLTVASPVLPFRFRFLGFPRSFQPGFPCLLSRFFVLGFLFVSFHPSRLRSHSCSTGASLLFRFLASASDPGFSARLLLSFVCFCSLLTTQPSALSFPFFPISPGSGSLGALRFLSSPTFPLPFRLFPCVPSDSGTQLPAFPFSASLFRVTGTTQLPASCFQLGRSPLLSL